MIREETILHPFLIKKIKKEILPGQNILHISDKHGQIDEYFGRENHLVKIRSLNELEHQNNHKSFNYVIADMDMSDLDDFNKFLDRIAPIIIRPGLLIIIASNLCTWQNKISFWFGSEPEDFTRPARAVPPAYLRNHLLAKGYKVKNRFWQYDKKLLIMADIPIKN